MAAVHEDEVGFEEGMLWCLPSHVLDEACHKTKLHTKHRHQNHQQLRHHKSSVEPQSQHSKCRSRSHRRPKNGNGGSGMQAIFLESGQRSSGTGVFLPQTPGINSQPRKKPACAPVLLPNRVIQALNLNMHTIGLQISPRQDSKYKPCGDVYSNSSKKKNDEKDGSKQCGDIRHNQNLYPAGIFLPKEWTY